MDQSLPSLSLPNPDAYGSRPAVEQSILSDYLDDLGVPRILSGTLDLPESIKKLRESFSAATQDQAVFCLPASEITDFVPACISPATVWYFNLGPTMERYVDVLLEAPPSVMGVHTDDPWRHSVAIYLAGTVATEASATRKLDLTFDSSGLNLNEASVLGFILAIFDFGQVLHVRGMPIGEELLAGLSGCEVSSFQRPTRVYSLRHLQTRTRSVEEIGIDPGNPPQEGHFALDVFTKFRSRDDGLYSKSHLPALSFYGIDSAVIGRLRNVTYFPEDLETEEEFNTLKMVVVDDVFAQVRAEESKASVHRIERSTPLATFTYLILVCTPGSVNAVFLEASDTRFQSCLNDWAAGGKFRFTVENQRNGRLQTLEMAWPSECVGGRNLDAGASVNERDRAVESWLHEYSRKREPHRRVKVYSAGTIDEAEWVEAAIADSSDSILG